MKILRVLFVLLMILSFTACSKSDKKSSNNNITNPEDFYENYEFAVMVSDIGDYKTEKLISIYPLAHMDSGEIPEYSYALKINGEDIELTDAGGLPFAFYDFTEGETYEIQATVDNTTKTENLTIVNKPTDPFPETFDPTVGMELNWTMPNNPMIQEIYAWSSFYAKDKDEDDFDEKYVSLSPSARSYSIQANWLNDYDHPEETEYDFELSVMNYVASGDYVFVSLEMQEGYYNFWKKLDVTEIHKRVIERLINSL